MSRPILQLLATARIPVALGSLCLATSASAPATSFQGGDCSCRHLEYPDMNESNYVSDTSFSRVDSVRVAFISASSPSPTVQLVANLRPAESQRARSVTVQVDPTADAIFMSTYAVENFLARSYDAKDQAKARALRAFVATHWGTRPRQMALLCQHHRDGSWSCSDSTSVTKYPGASVAAMTIYGVVQGRAGPATRAVRADGGTDAIFTTSLSCKMLEDYYARSSDPKLKRRGESLRAEIARRKAAR